MKLAYAVEPPMIINNKAHEDDSLPKAGPSSSLETRVDPFTDQPPPPFEERPTEPQEHLLIDLAENYHSTSDLDSNSEPPPDFSPYHADYFETDSGDVVSHDPHLNTDGTPYTLLEISAIHTEGVDCRRRGPLSVSVVPGQQ